MNIDLTPIHCIECNEEFLCRRERLHFPLCNFCISDIIDHTESTLYTYVEIYAENVTYANSAIAMFQFLSRLGDYEKCLAYKYLWSKQQTSPDGQDGIWWGVGESNP